MTTVLQDKKSLRQYALKKREYMSTSGITKINSQMILSNILNSKEFILSSNIALYFPIKGEIDLTGLLKVKNKNFYFPRCNGNELEFVKYSGEESLIVGKYNIIEPEGEATDPKILDIIYVPALIANKKGYRLGYGKGFYDRFFKKHNLKTKKIIVVANGLITNDFSEDSTDFKCDNVLSEKGLLFS